MLEERVEARRDQAADKWTHPVLEGIFSADHSGDRDYVSLTTQWDLRWEIEVKTLRQRTRGGDVRVEAAYDSGTKGTGGVHPCSGVWNTPPANRRRS